MILVIRMSDGQVIDHDQRYDDRLYMEKTVPDDFCPPDDRIWNYRWDGTNFVSTKHARLRAAAKSQIASAREVILRAIAMACLAEFNNHADKINQILDAAGLATSLADFKTRMAAIANYPTRTLAQLIAAINAAIDAGTAD